MAGKRGDAVRTEFYDPQLMGKLNYANNPTRNRVRLLERFYVNQLTQMSACRFTWTGLPEEIDERFLEMTIFQHGLAVFWHDDDKYNEYLVMRAGATGERNIYDNPVSYTVQGGTGVHALQDVISIEDCVPIWGNYLRTADLVNVRLWATRLANIDRTIELSAENARQTKLIGVPEEMRLSAENVLKQMNEGVGAVMGTPELMQIAASIQTIDLESHPSKMMNLLISKAKIWNEIMTFMGVNNSNQDKKERLVEDEVSANDEQIDLVKKMFIASRQAAAEQINKKFGLNVSVEFNQGDGMNIAGAEQGISANAIPNDRPQPGWKA